MAEWTAAEVARLVHEEQVSPVDLAIVSPFLSDSVRHALTHRLQGHGVQTHTYRPSRSLRDESAARCLITLARLAHPSWNLPVAAAEVPPMLPEHTPGI